MVVEFISGTTLRRELDRPSQLPIYRNGPAGTFVVFGHGLLVSLPTDQIVEADDSDGHVSVSFGGMAFVGVVDGRLEFCRAQELRPELELSPERSRTMFLEVPWVASVREHGRQVWPDVSTPERSKSSP